MRGHDAGAHRDLDALLERVSARLADGRRFLAGDRFTAADLTFAALGAVVLLPAEYGIPLPGVDEVCDEMRRHVTRWRGTPAGAQLLRLYREERRLPAKAPPPAVQ